MKEVIDNTVRSLSNYLENTGLVVGVLKRGHRSVFGYGRARDESTEPPYGGTVFEIGSITKVFTTTLLSILVAEGHLNLDDPVRDLIPSLSNLPLEITLIRLATHTSGLPKMPMLPLQAMFRNRSNPFAEYTTDDLLEYLSKLKTKRFQKSFGQIRYSNIGVALLGYILAEKKGMSFGESVISEICDKLDLPDTCITMNPGQIKRLAPPHSAKGKSNLNWDLPAFAGAGALRSTADDLLKFLAANLGTLKSSLTNALQACFEFRSGTYPRQGLLQSLVSARIEKEKEAGHYRQGMALGWVEGSLHVGGQQVHWHHGATGGYRSFAGFVKATHTGVVVLANRGPGGLDLVFNKTSADDIGFRVLEYLNSTDVD